MLEDQDFKAADQETTRIMCWVARREKEGYLRAEDIENFPCRDLHTIDQLWMASSGGRFGFSKQKQIWMDVDVDNRSHVDNRSRSLLHLFHSSQVVDDDAFSSYDKSLQSKLELQKRYFKFIKNVEWYDDALLGNDASSYDDALLGNDWCDWCDSPQDSSDIKRSPFLPSNFDLRAVHGHLPFSIFSSDLPLNENLKKKYKNFSREYVSYRAKGGSNEVLNSIGLQERWISEEIIEKKMRERIRKLLGGMCGLGSDYGFEYKTKEKMNAEGEKIKIMGEEWTEKIRDFKPLISYLSQRLVDFNR